MHQILSVLVIILSYASFAGNNHNAPARVRDQRDQRAQREQREQRDQRALPLVEVCQVTSFPTLPPRLLVGNVCTGTGKFQGQNIAFSQAFLNSLIGKTFVLGQPCSRESSFEDPPSSAESLRRGMMAIMQEECYRQLRGENRWNREDMKLIQVSSTVQDSIDTANAESREFQDRQICKRQEVYP